MCGRYHNRFQKQQIAEAFRAKTEPTLEIRPSYNVTPQSYQPVVVQDDEGERALTVMRWGLIPFWSKDGKTSYATFNAKAETIATSPLYREAFKRRRCLTPASGFYEWMKLDAKTKQPYSIVMKDGSPLAFAGLWDRWTDAATGTVLETYTIVTTDPNELMKPERGPAIHDRMPVIVPRRDYDRWLDTAGTALPVDLLRPFPAEELSAYKVKAEVGNVRNNTPDLCDEIGG